MNPNSLWIRVINGLIFFKVTSVKLLKGSKAS